MSRRNMLMLGTAMRPRDSLSALTLDLEMHVHLENPISLRLPYPMRKLEVFLHRCERCGCMLQNVLGRISLQLLESGGQL